MNFNRFGGGAGGMNLQQLMKQAQKMQEDMQATKAEIENTEFIARSGGGMVECVMMGDKSLKKLTINKQIVDPEDTEMLEDLVCVAVNDALAQIKKAEAEKMPTVPGM